MSGKCIIFSAPSGAGKTTIVKHLLGKDDRLKFSVSACSRDARVGEEHGKDYYFLGVEGFKNAIETDSFVEWEEVYPDNFYGTLKSELDRIWSLGKVVVFDVDVIGGLRLKKYFSDTALAVFVAPPNKEALEHRLRYRSTETEEKIQMRLAKSEKELSYAEQFDVVLTNDILENAFSQAELLVEKFLG